jgi:hypothetical protein
MITISAISAIFRQKISSFLKNNAVIRILHKLAVVFRQFFGPSILKIKTSTQYFIQRYIAHLLQNDQVLGFFIFILKYSFGLEGRSKTSGQIQTQIMHFK